jgi:hypothetical protein
MDPYARKRYILQLSPITSSSLLLVGLLTYNDRIGLFISLQRFRATKDTLPYQHIKNGLLFSNAL